MQRYTVAGERADPEPVRLLGAPLHTCAASLGCGEREGTTFRSETQETLAPAVSEACAP